MPKKYGTRSEVFDEQAMQTRGGLQKEDLMVSRTGKIVSKKKSEIAKQAYARWGFKKREEQKEEPKKKRRKKKRKLSKMTHLLDFVRQFKSEPLGEDEVLAMVSRPGLRAVEYGRIANKSLHQLLPKKVSGLLILFEDKIKNRKVGHYCLLFRHPRSGVHFFDPLGLGLLTVDRITGNSFQLARVLQKHHVTENTTKFQKMQSDVQSCGRHCAVRYNLADFTPEEYRQAIGMRSLSYDDVVTMITLRDQLKDWSKLLPQQTPYGHS